MDKLNKWNCLTYRGVARTLGVSVWRIRYAITSGYLPAPSVILKRRALFSPEQVEAMKGFFEVEDAHRRKGMSRDDSRFYSDLANTQRCPGSLATKLDQSP